MSRHRPVARVVAGVSLAVAALLPALVPSAAAHARPVTDVRTAAEAEATPLSVVLTSMTPGVVPARGAVRLSGQVRNSSREVWSDVNVAPFLSRSPITSRDELARASATQPSVAVGERLTDSGTYAALGDLAPGQVVPFSIRVPVDSLGITGEPGVYWIGVHALGTNADGRDLVADGRARTFIPLVDPKQARRRVAPVSLLLPLRERVRRAADGSVNGPSRWVDLTAPSGRLTRLVDFAESAGSAPVTWLVDPAVTDALADLGAGNPPLSLGPAQRADDGQGESPSESPSASASDSATPSASSLPSADPDGPDTLTADQRAHASSVLSTFLSSVRRNDLLALGYSDPDVAALARRRPSLISRADDLSQRRLAARGLTGTKTVAPPDGAFDPALLPQLAKDSLMVLSDRGRVQDPPSSRLPSGQELVLTDARSSAGGPLPTRPQDPLALRQRILAEAALEVAGTSAQEQPRPLVVSLPEGWDPGPAWRQADFFSGLATVPWVRFASLPRGSTTTYDQTLPYGREQVSEEIGDANVAATRALTRTGGVLGHLLDNRNDVEDVLTGTALGASSYSAREFRKLAIEQVMALNATSRGQMDRITVTTGDDFVTLSGGSGILTVTLVNGLEQPVTVGVQARSDSPDVKVETPDPVEMGPGQRTTLRLPVTSTAGVHDVTLVPVTSQDELAGQAWTFSLRTSQVGRLVWYIIIAGGALLAVMIVRRIVLRIRHHRWREDRT